MNKIKKSTAQDFELAYDNSADAVERAFAIRHLVFDRVYEIESLLVQLLKHDEEFLRGEAIAALLARWHKTQYIDAALQMLNSDASYVARREAAFALGEFAAFADNAEKYKDTIIRKLLEALLEDENWTVQQSSYEKILTLITGKIFVSEHLPQKAREFNRNQDADWNLLKPLLEKYNLQKSA